MAMKKRVKIGTPSLDVTQREIDNGMVSRIAARESFVLLENMGVLPLKKGSKLAAYGGGAKITLKGGTGSGDVNERRTVPVCEGLENAGFELTSKEWLDDYAKCYEQARLDWKDEIFRKAGGDEIGMNFFMAYSTTQFVMPAGNPIDTEKAKADGADVALFVISRIAGEAADRHDVKGDYYLLDEEKALLAQVCESYKSVVLVLNIGGLIDLKFKDEFKNIDAVLQMGQAGQEGGNALADVLCGDVTPSGKLTDTWPENYEDIPCADYFSYKSGDVYKEEYKDGIFVGYRYFDTFNVPVRYCFGHGISYTNFDIKAGSLSVKTGSDAKVSLKATVKNMGDTYSGKEVVQVYVSCPQGKLIKEFRRLAAFGKTKLLAPGEEQTLDITFSLSGLESYSYEDERNILEAGVYGVWVGSSLENADLVGTLTLDEGIATECVEHILPLKQELTELTPDREKVLIKENAWKKRAEGLENVDIKSAELLTTIHTYEGMPTEFYGKAGEIVNSLTVDELIALSSGDPSADQSALGGAGQTVPGAAAETVALGGVRSMVLADGPAGIRLKQKYTIRPDGTIYGGSIFDALEKGFFSTAQEVEGTKYYQFCTSIPVGSVLAQSWDTDLIKKVGAMIGSEMNLFEVTLWLAPGMNIHRNPLCGRNFEYYSEDPLVAGMMAGAMTLGVQSQAGCGTTIKHYACNNCEDNRMGSDAVVSERALREIYLKGFEIAVKNAQPMSIMTSYNLINGVHTANSYDLCTKVARDEWGFEGAIMTDWTTTVASTAGECTARGCMKAGNDMVMPGAPADHESIRNALADGTLTMDELKCCIWNTARISLQSNQFEGAVSYSEQFCDLDTYMTAK